MCRPCDAARLAAWNRANPDRVRAGHQRRKDADRDGWRARKRAWAKRSQARHPEKWAARSKAHYEANRAERLAYAKAYAAAHPDKVRAYKRAYDRKDPARHAQRVNAWAEKNRARKAAANAAWAKANPDRRAVIDQRRRAVKAAVPNTLTHSEWLEVLECFEHRCAYCLRSDARLTQDHVIPIARRGEHTASNVVPACQACNAKKGDRPIFMMARFI